VIFVKVTPTHLRKTLEHASHIIDDIGDKKRTALAYFGMCVAAHRREATMAKRKTTTKPKATKRKATKRELINTGTDKRFVRRSTKGTYKESDDVGRSLAEDRQQKAKKKVKSGQGDRGDR
jgi:hypothetical protein